jgi:hypothetical protein
MLRHTWRWRSSGTAGSARLQTFGLLVGVVKLEVAGENGDYVVQQLGKGVVARRLSGARDKEKKWGLTHRVTWEEGGSGERRAGLKAAGALAQVARGMGAAW